MVCFTAKAYTAEMVSRCAQQLLSEPSETEDSLKEMMEHSAKAMRA